MAEVLKDVKTVLVNYSCDFCGVGNMKPTGECMTSYPPKYPHVCGYCGRSQTFRVQYPYTKTVPIDE